MLRKLFFLTVALIVSFSVVNAQDNFDLRKFHMENLPEGDNPPPMTDFSNTGYGLYMNYYAGLNSISVNPSSDTGMLGNGMSTRITMNMTGDGQFYPHGAIYLTLPSTYPVRPLYGFLYIMYPHVGNGVNDISMKEVVAVRNDVGGGDTNASSTIQQNVQTTSGLIVQYFQASLGNTGAGAWKQWIIASASGSSFVGTKTVRFYVKGGVIMPNGDTVWCDNGSGTLNVPPFYPQGPYYPAPGAINVPINPLCFNWANVPGIRYRLQVATNENFPAWSLVHNSIVDNPPACVYGLTTGTQYFWRVSSSYEPSGPWGGWTPTLNFHAGQVVGINSNQGEIPKTFVLYQNYPNPFNPVTNIAFDIPQKGNVKLYVFDILGREIATLVNQVMDPGSYRFDYNASELSSGIYFYKLETDGFTNVKKMMLVK